MILFLSFNRLPILVVCSHTFLYNRQHSHLDYSVECGNKNKGKAARCCPGYKCKKNSQVCEAVKDELKPLKDVKAKVQSSRYEISDKIEVTGSTFKAVGSAKTLTIPLPKQAEPDDFMVLFIGGSAGAFRRPKAPDGWKLIFSEGSKDINLMALYRWCKKGDCDWQYFSSS